MFLSMLSRAAISAAAYASVSEVDKVLKNSLAGVVFYVNFQYLCLFYV